MSNSVEGQGKVEQATLERIEQKISEEVTKRFPGVPIERVSLLQYGDDPVIEPGELLIRVVIPSGDTQTDREEALEGLHKEHRRTIEQFREDLAAKLPEVRRVEFRTSGDDGHGPIWAVGKPPRSLESRALAGGELTPVMARLGPADLETLDTLITAGIAPNRAEAVRWALARIRERPAYSQLVQHSQQIEELKAQF